MSRTNYAVELAPAAQRDLRRLDRAIARRVLHALLELQNDSRPPGCRMLRGAEGLYRIRTGDYRTIYQIDDDRKLVTVARIRHRSDVYR
ncbi:MAG TPA: type II toxin-antitoxin system RelE/ParE family toxin [Candidatus Binataceae bacterium]|nr:type II toxin-antitoxin system RelE/ParE family toxin [Candidatus Binataceae bacterium]